MAAEKGLYRSIYSAIWEDPEFQAFDPDMMVVFFSLRTCRECNFPCIFSFYRPLLYERIPKMSPERIDAAFDRLIEAGWVQYERPVLWIVKGFKNEPSRVPKNQKQIDGVRNILNSLAKVRIVTRFREHYGFPAPPPDAGIHEGMDAGMDEGMDAPPSGRNEGRQGASKQRTGTGTGTGKGKGTGSGAGTANDEPKTADASAGASRPPLARPPGNGDGEDTATASGKKGQAREAGLKDVARLVRIGEIDLTAAYNRLKTYGFTPSEIRSPEIVELLKQEAN